MRVRLRPDLRPHLTAPLRRTLRRHAYSDTLNRPDSSDPIFVTILVAIVVDEDRDKDRDEDEGDEDRKALTPAAAVRRLNHTVVDDAPCSFGVRTGVDKKG